MSANSPTEFARATLLRLTEEGLAPTPENYSRIYAELSGAVAPVPAETATSAGVTVCAQLLDMVRSIVESTSNSTVQLATNLGENNAEIRQSINSLQSSVATGPTMDLLQKIVERASLIQTAVEDTQADLNATRATLDHIRVELQEARQELNEDALTGAKNRRALDTLLAQEVARAKRNRTQLSVAMVDIDHFKQINDTHGHDAGDKLLMHLSTITKSVLRGADGLVRYGGEEFLLILPDTDLRGAEFVVNRLKQVVQKTPMFYEGKKLSVTFSGGIAELQPEENGHALIRRADSALYKAKHAGRNRYVVDAG
jgi:diguanylate cyclase